MSLAYKPNNINYALIKLICKHNSPKKVKTFLWPSAYRSLNTDDRLQRKFRRWGGQVAECVERAGRLDNLFLHCDFAYQVQSYLARMFGLTFCLAKNIDD